MRRIPDDPVNETALDDEAAAWICEREEGFTPERALAFNAWRHADQSHAAAIVRVERSLALLDEMPLVAETLDARFGLPECDSAAAASPVRDGWFSLPAWSFGLAALLMLALGVGFWSVTRTPAKPEERYATETAGQRRFVLSDGSVLDLNAQTEVRVQLARKERRVTLVTGEAHFQVASDAGRPFVVTAGGVSVRAVGTAFNVRLAETTVDVLVVEGRVEVTLAVSPARPAAEIRPQLTAGERTVVDRKARLATLQVEQVAPALIGETLAWQNPLMTFLDVPLRQVISQFNRRNATQLLLDDPKLGDRRIGGAIALDQVDGFVWLLEQEGDIVAVRAGEGSIVLRRKR